MQKIVLSTGNLDKVRELTQMLDQEKFQVLSKNDLGLGDFEIEETGRTLNDNAEIKVIELYKALKARGEDPDQFWILADDTGLFVPAIRNLPGVYSARYAGENATYDDNINKLLKRMTGLEMGERNAYFMTVIAVIKNGELFEYQGRLEGRILEERRGEGGFGYDPVFYVIDQGKTLAEMTLEEKNKISHRSQAFRSFLGDIHE